MHIRPYTPQDAAALTHIFHAAVHQIGARDYTPDQVAAWSPQPISVSDYHARVSDGRTVFVAIVPDNRPIGFIELEQNGHIDCFYCHPAHAGSGVGQALYAALETTAKDQNVSALFVEASEAARRFFLKNGFTLEHRRDFQRNGVDIHNYAMRKEL